MPSKQLQLKDARKKKKEKEATGAESAAAAPAALPAAAHEKKPVGRPKNKPSAEPLVRRDPDRICLDDGRAFLAGDFPGNRERERRESSCQGKGRSSRAKGSRGDPFSLLFAALICLLLSEKHSRTTEKQELVFLNAVLPEKKHEGCSNNSRRARRGSNTGPSKGRRQEGE